MTVDNDFTDQNQTEFISLHNLSYSFTYGNK